MCGLASNPYVWGGGADTISGPVMKLDFTDSSGNTIDVASGIELAFKGIGSTTTKTTNITDYIDDSGMTFHKVNVMSSKSALILEFNMSTGANALLEFYLKQTYSPTTTSYDYMVIVNQTEKTIVVVPEEFLPSVGIYYIGLRTKYGKYSCPCV